MRNIRSILSILFIITFFGCSNKQEKVIKFYPNGNLMTEVELRNGEKNGKHIEYYENGSVKSVSYWIKNLKQDYDTTFYENGNIESIASWKNTQQNGEAKFFYRNGNLRSVSNWQMDVPTGEGRIYYENGEIKEIYYKKEGGITGLNRQYYDNGNLKVKGYYKEGLKHGRREYYYDSGELWTVNSFLNFRGKETHTGGVEFDKNGKIIHETIRIEAKAEKDTIILGDDLILHVELKKPIVNHSKLVIGCYDESFYVTDSTCFAKYPMKNHKAIYQVKSQNKGLQFVRGYVSNYEIIDKKKNITRESHTYLEYPYFVK
jgi:antitoxin component YwqK of YwqJK toxin-antitoxin module